MRTGKPTSAANAVLLRAATVFFEGFALGVVGTVGCLFWLIWSDAPVVWHCLETAGLLAVVSAALFGLCTWLWDERYGP